MTRAHGIVPDLIGRASVRTLTGGGSERITDRMMNEITTEKHDDRALRAVEKMLDVLEAKIDSDWKCSVGDYIRLLQLERELKAEQVKEIKVTWQETKKQQED